MADPNPGPLSISRLITWLAEQDPDRPAITDAQGSLSRAELDRRSNRLARAYAGMGVREGDMVTVALPNGREFFEACVAIWKLGATPQPVSARLPFVEREAIVELADPSLIVGVEEDLHPGHRSVHAGFEPDPSLSDEALPDAVSRFWKAPTSGGSTGRPKIIVAEQPGVFDPQEPAVFYMEPNGVQLVPGPLYHNGPFIYSMRGLFCGHSLVVMERFDAERALALMERHGVTWVLLVPTMMQRIWRLPEEVRTGYDLSALKTVLHLGAPCPPWLKRAWIDWLGADRIMELYAGTEAQGVTFITGQEWLDHPGSVGRPALGTQFQVLDEDGNPCSPGEVGEVFMMPAGGPGTTYHYLGAEPKSRDGWESLGDLGYVDEDGFLYLTDRSADMILSGGANIYPAEVEAAIDSHPAVRSSAVIGLPHEDMGASVHAVVDALEPVSEDDLRRHVAERIAGYKVPRTFEFVAEPVRDDAGKVRRSQLRAERLG